MAANKIVLFLAIFAIFAVLIQANDTRIAELRKDLEVAVKEGRFVDAAGIKDEIDQLQNKQPTNTAAELMQKGIKLFEEGRQDEAKKVLDMAVKQDPKNQQARLNFAAILFATKEFDQALIQYDEILKDDPRSFDAHFNKGLTLLNMDKLWAAESSLGFAKTIEPDNAKVYSNLGAVYQRQGWNKDAIETYRKAIQLDPKYARAHFNLAAALLQEGQVDEAATHYLKLKELDPSYSRDLEFALKQAGAKL